MCIVNNASAYAAYSQQCRPDLIRIVGEWLGNAVVSEGSIAAACDLCDDRPIRFSVVGVIFSLVFAVLRVQ